jgi:hypothetical protein
VLKTLEEKTLLQHLSNRNNIPEMDCEISKHTFVSTINQHMTKLIWPHEAKPGRTSFKIWLKILHLTFDINGQNILPNPLGPSTMNEVIKRKIEWLAYYDKINNLVALPD